MQPLYRYRFGTTLYDEATGELVVDGLPVELQSKPLRLLSILLGRAGDVVSREALLQAVWDDRYRSGESNVLPNAVGKLRAALAGDADAIETVPRRGYRFAAGFERTLVGRTATGALDLKAGAPVPSRRDVVLVRRLACKPGQEVWLARRSDGEQRVFKFATGGERLADLRREARLSRVLVAQLGEREDILAVLSSSFAAPPCFVERAFGGMPLDEWAARDANLARLSIAERIDLFVAIATPVAASHRVPIFHKDLKPANVLVDERDGRRVVGLTDFGSGSLADPERLALLGLGSLSATLDMKSADELVQGSFPYLAPEAFRGEPASAQSDLYALGVLLYQIAVADFAKPLAPGWDRTIDDAELADDIRQATDGDPARRFASVEALIASLQRRAERRAARLREAAEAAQTALDRAALARARARRPWIAATFAVIVVALGVSTQLYLGLRATQAALGRQAGIAKELNRFLTDDLIAQADPSVAGRADVTVAQAASAAAASIDATPAATDPAVRASLHLAMQQAFDGLGDLRASVDEGMRVLRALEARPDPDLEIRARVLLAIGLAQLGRSDDAAASLAPIRTRADLSALHDAALAVQVRYAEGFVLSQRFDLEHALPAFQGAWNEARRMPDFAPKWRERVLFQLADTERMANRPADAEQHARLLLTEQRRRWGAVHPRPCYTATELALILGNEGRLDEAIAELQSAVACLGERMGRDARKTLIAVDALAQLQLQRADYAGAASIWSSIADRVSALGAGSTWALSVRTNVALAHRLEGDLAAATTGFEKAFALASEQFAADEPQLQLLRFWLADCLLERQPPADAAALLEGLSASALNRAEIEDDWEGRLAFERGRLALAQGQQGLARERFGQAGDVFTARHSTGLFSAERTRELMRRAGL